MVFNFDRGLSFTLQRLGGPGMRLKPEQLASILAICKRQSIIIRLLAGFGKSVCYKMMPFVMEMIPFVMGF